MNTGRSVVALLTLALAAVLVQAVEGTVLGFTPPAEIYRTAQRFPGKLQISGPKGASFGSAS